jgi:hypothetical protein
MADSIESGVAGSGTRRADTRPGIALGEQAPHGQPQGGPDAVPEIVHGGAVRSDDRQVRRYAHTLRRNTPPSVPTLDSAGSAIPSEQRDISTIAMPKLSRGERPTTSNLRARPPIARAGSEPAIPRASSEPAIPCASSEPAIPCASSEPAIPRASSEPAIPRASSEPAIRASSQTAIARASEPEIDFASPERKAAWPSSDPTNPASAPTESTAIYRKRNTRPTLTAAEPEPIARDPTKPLIVSATPIGPAEESPGEDAPSCLPSVMMDAAAPRRALRPVAPQTPLGRVILPIALAALMVIATWLLRSIL